MALVATVGSASANSYATVDFADAYFEGRPNVTAWTGASDDTKEAALLQAALLLDAMFAWTGSAVDAVQALAWPRAGMLTRNGFSVATTVVPNEVKRAQCEYARVLIAGDITADNDAAKQGISSVKAGSVAVTFQTKDKDTTEAVLAQQSQMFYLSKSVPDVVRFLLVPSWYTEANLESPFIFDGVF